MKSNLVVSMIGTEAWVGRADASNNSGTTLALTPEDRRVLFLSTPEGLDAVDLARHVVSEFADREDAEQPTIVRLAKSFLNHLGME